MINKKRLGVLLLAGTMIMGMSTTAFAAGNGTPTVGQSNVDQGAKAPIKKNLEQKTHLKQRFSRFNMLRQMKREP